MDATVALYDDDGLQPSVEGSYLAALVLDGRLAGQPVVGLPGRVRLATGRTLAVDASHARLLQSARPAEVLGQGAAPSAAADR
jgi:hypothetical protein